MIQRFRNGLWFDGLFVLKNCLYDLNLFGLGVLLSLLPALLGLGLLPRFLLVVSAVPRGEGVREVLAGGGGDGVRRS